MRRLKILFLLMMFISPLICDAQDEVLPLLDQMKKSTGVEKIKLLNEISVVYRKSDRNKSLDFARQAFSLSEEYNYLPGKALAMKNEGICWFFIGNN